MPGSHQQMNTDQNAYYIQPQFSADQAQYPAGFADPSAYYYQHGTSPLQSSPLTPIETQVAGAGRDAGPDQIKWSRIALLILGVAVVGFAFVNLTKSTSGAVKDAKKTAATNMAPVTTQPAMNIKPRQATAHANAAPKAPAAHKASAAQSASRLTGRHNGHTTGNAHRSVRVSGTMPGMNAARGPYDRTTGASGGRSSVRGRSGTSGATALPYTGASTWIAAVIGVLMLAAGVFVQYKALAIGETAAMYRRGPLLRPFWLIALTIRNAPRAAAFVAQRMPELARACVRARTALDARGIENDYVSARRS